MVYTSALDLEVNAGSFCGEAERRVLLMKTSERSWRTGLSSAFLASGASFVAATEPRDGEASL